MNVQGDEDVSLANLSEIFIYLEFEHKRTSAIPNQEQNHKAFFLLSRFVSFLACLPRDTANATVCIRYYLLTSRDPQLQKSFYRQLFNFSLSRHLTMSLPPVWRAFFRGSLYRELRMTLSENIKDSGLFMVCSFHVTTFSKSHAV